MKKVAIFGNAGGGKSTLARRLAQVTGLPLYVVDIMKFPSGVYQPSSDRGGAISLEAYVELHAHTLRCDRWIIDGFESIELAWERFAAADTLVYIDLPIFIHYWGVTTRFATGLFRTPRGWPENSPIWESTWDGYRVVGRCHCFLTPRYRRLVSEMAAVKRVHHLRSRREIAAFIAMVIQEHKRLAPDF